MSIPKEPRQIMINIMYLVLTALLALNVSAEIFNAFKMIDKGLKQANHSLDEKNRATAPEIIKRAKAKKIYEQYAERVPLAQQYSNELGEYIDNLVNELIDKSGNNDGVVDDKDKFESTGEWRGLRNKDITTRMLVEGGKGEELRQKILEYRDKFAALFDEEDRAKEVGKLPLSIDDEGWKKSLVKRKNWADFVFNHMPLGATLPIFNKFKNDAKVAESTVLNYLMGKVGGENVVLDKFVPLSSPKKSYVVMGEPFETEISLGASAGNSSNTGIDIKVNGTRLKTDADGIAKWKTVPRSVGVKKYNVAITVVNPVTKESNTYSKTFEYEVGQRSVSVSLDSMKVFYIGVNNPVTIAASGVSSNQLQVAGSGININKKGNSHYVVTASRPGRASITVSGGGLQPSKFYYTVKRIPDPIPMIGKLKGGSIGNGTFKAFPGVRAVLQNFNFNARCKVKGFRLVRIAKRKDPELVSNRGGKYTPEARALVNKARPGDKYFFENIKAVCPGDKAGRPLSQMVFNIR